MENEATQSADLYQLAAWAHKNRKQLITVTVIVVAVAVIFGGYYLYENGRETTASEALSNIKQPMTPAEAAIPPSVEPYLKIVDEYSGTTAAARALLIAAGIQFDSGKFKDAQMSFDKFMSQYSSSPLANQAQLGVAASLEAQGNVADATSRYEELVKRHAADSTTPQAKSALARLYLAQNKPDLAFQQYDELVKAGNNDTWTSEATIQREELIAKYPKLAKPAVAPMPDVKANMTPVMTPAVPTAPTTPSATVTVPANATVPANVKVSTNK